MAEALTINGVSLDSYAFMDSDISGLLTVPGRVGENVKVPNRHGRIRTVGKTFDSNEIILPLWIVGCEPDGSIPIGSDERREFFKRKNELLQLLYADPCLVQFTRPDGHVVQAAVEMAAEPLDFTRRHDEPIAQVSVALEIYGAFWEDADSVSQSITGVTGTEVELTEFEGATAPMSDVVITVFGPANNPQFSHGARWVKYNGALTSGQQLQIDTGSWIVGPGTGTLWTPTVANVDQGRPGPWFEIDPATVPYSVIFTHTTGGSASASISGRRKYLAP